MVGASTPWSSSAISNLFCEEDKFWVNEEEEDDQMGTQLIYSQPMFIPCLDSGCDDDYIKFLVRKEQQTDFGSEPLSGSWLIHARLDAINWILHNQILLGLRNQTAYLSVTYFDRYLSATRIEEDEWWTIRLLSIACLSLAVKMEETKAVSLFEYSTKKDYRFQCQHIQKMELLVLGSLEWNMRLITPFPYLHYFSNKLGDHGAKLDQLISRSMELLMAIIKEISLMDYRPSVIAAAAVLAATDWQLTQEALKCKISTLSLLEWEPPENEQLFSCYNIMQRLSAKSNLSTPNSSEVHDQTPCADTSIAAVGTKRRLRFSDSDEVPEKIQRDSAL